MSVPKRQSDWCMGAVEGPVEEKKKKKKSTHLHIFQAVLLTNTPKHVFLTTFLHLSRQQEFVQDKVCLLEVEDDVKFADVAVIFVHLLHVSMDDLQGDQFVVGRRASGDEEQRGIATVDDFGIYPKEERQG